MGELRYTTTHDSTLANISQSTDLKNTLELMVGLQGKPFMEEKIPTKYSSETGRPTQYSWQPYKTFGTEFAFKFENLTTQPHVHLQDKVVDEIKKGPVYFSLNQDTYFAKYEERRRPDESGGLSCVEHLIHLTPARPI